MLDCCMAYFRGDFDCSPENSMEGMIEVLSSHGFLLLDFPIWFFSSVHGPWVMMNAFLITRASIISFWTAYWERFGAE